MERWESAVSQYEEKSKNKMNDEIKVAANRLRTFEDARREVVTYVEKQFGFKIRDSKPSDMGLREHSEVGAVHSLLSVEGNGSSVSRMGCFKCDGAQFQRDSNASTNAGTRLSGKGNQGKSWSESESSITGRGKGQENNGKSIGRFLWTGEGAIHVSKGSGNSEILKTVISDLENLKSETSPENQESVQMGQVCVTETSLIHEEWSPDEKEQRLEFG